MNLTKPLAAICSVLLMTITAPAYSAPPAQTAASDYGAGVYLVYRGRRLETAIQKLGEAVRKEPSNPTYHLALGCALLRRATVLHDAAASASNYVREKAAYPARFAVWEKAQQDPKSLLNGAAPPLIPTPPTTRDDDKPFTLTLAQARERSDDLCRRARTEWDAAVAKADTDAERANTQYVRGWGMILLLRIKTVYHYEPAGSTEYGHSIPWLEKSLVPNHAQIADAFQAALAVEPNNALYWQSLGDAYVLDVGPQEWSPNEAAAAYTKALALNRRNPTLWWQLYRIEEDIAKDEAAALAAINGACAADPSNAYYAYLQAHLLLKRFAGKAGDYEATDAEKRDSHPDRHSPDLVAGLASIDRGNSGTFRPDSYRYGIPKILAPLSPIDIGISYALYDLFILQIPPNVALAVKADLAAGDSAAAVATGRTVARFGENMLTLSATNTIEANEFLAWSFSSNAVYSGYSSLIDALEGAGDADGAAKARARREELYTVAHQKVLRAQERYTAFLR